MPLPLPYGTGLFDHPLGVYLLLKFGFHLKPFLSATSIDVEHIFSHGHLLLSHVHSRLSVQSTRALLCLGSWSWLSLVKDTNVLAVTVLDDVEGDEKPKLDVGWDQILL